MTTVITTRQQDLYPISLILLYEYMAGYRPALITYYPNAFGLLSSHEYNEFTLLAAAGYIGFNPTTS